MSTCVGSVGAGDDGVNVVNLLRSLKGKVCACIPLVQSLVATQGEHFHHIFLQQALQNARASGVVVTSAIDDLLSVRHITALAEAMDWKQLVLTLEETYVKSSNVHELRHQGLVHALEYTMRSPVGNQGDSSEPAEKKNAIGKQRILMIKSLIEEAHGHQKLWSSDQLNKLRDEFQHLQVIIEFTIGSLDGTCNLDPVLANIEISRTVLVAKTSSLNKCVTCFPLALWMNEIVQDKLAEYHSQAGLITGLEKSLLCL